MNETISLMRCGIEQLLEDSDDLVNISDDLVAMTRCLVLRLKAQEDEQLAVHVGVDIEPIVKALRRELHRGQKAKA